MLNFYCIGAQKAGTTWLYEMLTQHPDIAPNPRKEIHFWDMYHHKGLEWYRDVFSKPNKIQGDFTPAYAILPKDTIAQCYEHFPDLKFIYIVRDPIERIWSALMMELHRQGHPASQYPDDDTIHQFISRKDTIARSLYYDCYKNWSSIYPEENFLILHFEDIASNPKELLEQCFAFLGLDTTPAHNIRGIHKKKFSKKLSFEIHPMLSDTQPKEIQTQWQLIQPHITHVKSPPENLEGF